MSVMHEVVFSEFTEEEEIREKHLVELKSQRATTKDLDRELHKQYTVLARRS